METVRALILACLAAVQEALDELRSSYPAFENPLAIRAEARDGILPSGRRFTFHGIGCRFETSTLVVDWDLGPNDRTDGFDAWRLCSFAQNISVDFPNHQQIEAVLEEMHQTGEVVKAASEDFAGHLYFRNP